MKLKFIEIELKISKATVYSNGHLHFNTGACRLMGFLSGDKIIFATDESGNFYIKKTDQLISYRLNKSGTCLYIKNGSGIFGDKKSFTVTKITDPEHGELFKLT